MKNKKTSKISFRLEEALREMIQSRAAERRIDEADIIREVLWDRFGPRQPQPGNRPIAA